MKQDNKAIKLSKAQKKAFELIAGFYVADKKMKQRNQPQDDKSVLDWCLSTADMAISIQQKNIDAANKLINEWENVKKELHKTIQL